MGRNLSRLSEASLEITPGVLVKDFRPHHICCTWLRFKVRGRGAIDFDFGPGEMLSY